MFKTLFKDKNKVLEELDAKIQSKNRDLAYINEQIEILRKDIAKLETSRKNLEQQLEEAKHAPVRACKASLDWQTMNAFSVERLFSTNHGAVLTSVGYLVGNTVKEWILFVNEEVHNELVEDFKQYVAKKTNL